MCFLSSRLPGCSFLVTWESVPGAGGGHRQCRYRRPWSSSPLVDCGIWRSVAHVRRRRRRPCRNLGLPVAYGTNRFYSRIRCLPSVCIRVGIYLRLGLYNSFRCHLGGIFFFDLFLCHLTTHIFRRFSHLEVAIANYVNGVHGYDSKSSTLLLEFLMPTSRVRVSDLGPVPKRNGSFR